MKRRNIKEVFEFACKTYWSQERFQKSGHAKEVIRNYENHIQPVFGARALHTLRPKQVRAWHAKFADTPFAGNRSLEVLSSLFRIGQEQEWVKQGINPCTLIKPFTERKRTRYATKEEVKKILEILEKEKEVHPKAVAFLYTLLYTGSRPSLLERIKWSDIEFSETEKGETFAIVRCQGKSTARTGDKEVLVIPPQACEVLEQSSSPVKEFDLGFKRNTKLVLGKMPRRLWDKIRKEAGCPDLWARDFRRTFATIGFSAGLSSDTIGELQNHRSAQTRMLYQKMYVEKKVETALEIANKIEGMK